MVSAADETRQGGGLSPFSFDENGTVPVRNARPQIRLDPDNARNGIVQLVLTVIELLRDLLERQALRRIESGSLRPDEEERLGLTFLRLSEEMDRLKEQFQLTDEDLNLNLGPLGRLR
jgi:hypothetical protein